MVSRLANASVIGLLWAALSVQAPLQAVGQQSQAAKRPRTARPDLGKIADGAYQNPTFGFSYRIPFGWVDRTAAMQQADSAEPAAQPPKSQVMLAVFERPPEAPRSAVNAGVVIAAESVSSYPGLKAAVEYFGPLEQVATSKGFKVLNEPYEFQVGGKSVAREDFSQEAGEMTMHQTFLVILEKGYLVSFTLISDSDDAMDELLEGLNFHPSLAPARSHPASGKK